MEHINSNDDSRGFYFLASIVFVVFCSLVVIAFKFGTEPLAIIGLASIAAYVFCQLISFLTEKKMFKKISEIILDKKKCQTVIHVGIGLFLIAAAAVYFLS